MDAQDEQTVDIEAIEVGGSFVPRLHVPPMDLHNDVWMAPATAVSERQELMGTYEGTGCLWLEVDGERYEMWGEWLSYVIEDGTEYVILGADLDILVRPGDLVRVQAQASPLFSSAECGGEQGLLVWDIVPAS